MAIIMERATITLTGGNERKLGTKFKGMLTNPPVLGRCVVLSLGENLVEGGILRTSKVQEIRWVNDSTIVFQTMNSEYTLVYDRLERTKTGTTKWQPK